VPVVVALCSVSDVLLIAAGVAGLGAALGSRPSLLQVVRLAGVAFLFSYGAMAARRAWQGQAGLRDDQPVVGRRSAVATTLALTWLNPGVYLDTVVLLGTVAHTRGGGQPGWFGAGAALGSVLWFTGLGFGARLLSGRLTRPGTWRAVDAFVAAVMLVTGARVLLG
jgi:L-lysine exporter family protein LysE/ArgO